MMSGLACAVPAIMATRVIPNRRDRIATILAAFFGYIALGIGIAIVGMIAWSLTC